LLFGLAYLEPILQKEWKKEFFFFHLFFSPLVKMQVWFGPLKNLGCFKIVSHLNFFLIIILYSLLETVSKYIYYLALLQKTFPSTCLTLLTHMQLFIADHFFSVSYICL
jgi:hypothetical protein